MSVPFCVQIMHTSQEMLTDKIRGKKRQECGDDSNSKGKGEI